METLAEIKNPETKYYATLNNCDVHLDIVSLINGRLMRESTAGRNEIDPVCLWAPSCVIVRSKGISARARDTRTVYFQLSNGLKKKQWKFGFSLGGSGRRQIFERR